MAGPIIHVVGARPNFPKAAPVLASLNERGASQLLVHTGQHYDDRMSGVFFEQLGLPKPDVNLGVGSGSHATQTADVMVALEPLLLEYAPAMVVVYGDVNSTIAATLVASKLGIPIAHVEAGLRSFDMSMPEEINRIVTDRLSDLLFVTSPDGLVHLGHEGIAPGRVHLVGNPMIDTLQSNLDECDPELVKKELELPDRYAVATLHRPGNVDDTESLPALVDALSTVAELVPLVIPLHPRGRARLTEAGLQTNPRLRVLEPQAYREFISLLRGAAVVITDSGGVQEETTYLGIPCLTLRPNTERPVTITHGTNRLTTVRRLAADACGALASSPESLAARPPMWDGLSGARIAALLLAHVH